MAALRLEMNVQLGELRTAVAQQTARIDNLSGQIAELTVRMARVEDRLGIETLTA